MSTSLADRLHHDMVAALKAQQKERLTVLRMLVAAVQEAALHKRGALVDEDTLRVLQSYAKKREETLAECRKAGRTDLAEREEFELSVLRDYLPRPLSDAELGALVDAVIAELGASSPKDMGRVMKVSLERAAGRADGARVSPLVKARLSV